MVRSPFPGMDLYLLDIGQALQTAYQRARYDLRIDYHAPCDPPLAAEDAQWSGALVARSAPVAGTP